jgi:transposase
MCAWLTECGVTHVAMEATGIYSNPVFHALVESGDFEVIKVNPAHVKNLPGRKTDPLTELPGGVPQVSGRRGALVATVADHDHRRRYATGPVAAGDAAGRVA